MGTADEPTGVYPICGGLATDVTYTTDDLGRRASGTEPTSTLTLRICENVYCEQHDPRTAPR